MPERLTNRRRVAAVVVVGLLVAFAGCSGFGGSPPDEATTAEPTTGSSATPATESGTTSATADSDGTTATNESTDATATSDGVGTTAANDGTDSTADDSRSHSHGTSSSHGETTTDSESDEPIDSPGADESAGGTNDADPNGTTTDSVTNESTGLSGKMTVVVAATELPLDELATGDRISVAADDEHTWRADSRLDLADALATFGVDANATSLTYNGTTYREATNGTTVGVGVNGEPVDPESYALRDGDQVWVAVETADADYSVPGEYIPPDQQHVHGSMEFLVDGQAVDFAVDSDTTCE